MATNGTGSPLEQFSAKEAFFGLRTLFYACTPSESSFETIEQVPPIVNKASPFFFLLIALEVIALHVKGRRDRLPRWNDAISSLSAGLVSEIPRLLVLNVEVVAYVWMYNHWHIYALPWDSAWTWWLTMLGVDLGYYWVHRCAHEINFMWAGHQTHHSSEDYNLTTALRQGLFQRFSSWIFYLPMAFFIPPSVFVVHIQFNLLYQFWIHTETIKTLGPLEWILNTPSHHRVHHGINRYCIDKNYAGVLIIWDRIFGTFEAENEVVVYGLTHQLNSWNPIYTQTSHWLYILSTIWNTKGFTKKLSYLLKGPGWEPGKPRLGLKKDIPDVKFPVKKFNNHVKGLLNIYCVLHFVLTLILYETLVKYKETLDLTQMFFAILFLLWTLTDIGFIFEQRSKVEWLELCRCCLFLFVDHYLIYFTGSPPIAVKALRYLMPISVCFCIFKIVKEMVSSRKKID